MTILICILNYCPQCPPLTDIVKLVQTQLVSFYVTLTHKDQLSKVFFIGGSWRYRVYRGVKSTLFYCSVPTKVWKLPKKAHLVNKNPRVNKFYFGFKVLNPEN